MDAIELYNILSSSYGPPIWWSDDPYKVMFEAVLVQQTNWRSVKSVSSSLKNNLKPEYILSLSKEKLIEIIKPCGFSRAKAETIISLTSWYGSYGFEREKVEKKDKEMLRAELLDIKGIGYESADVILVFAFHKPSFIIDAYTRRFLERLGFAFKNDNEIRAFFESTLPSDYLLYGYYHYLILKHSIERCKKKPECSQCPFSECKNRGQSD